MNPRDVVKQHIKYDKIAHVYFLAGPPECASEKENFVADITNLLRVPPANRVIIGKNEDAITIDMMRDLKTITASSAGCFLPGAENTPRIVMIYHADCFTAQAANAFLKTLEEPPSHTIFFLLASSRAGILPTMLSRAWTVRFSRPTFFHSTFNWGETQTFFQRPLAERYAINEKLAKLDDHGKQFLAELITYLRYETKNGIKKPALRAGRAADILPHAMEAYELLHLPGAPYRLILDTLASYEVNR